MEETNVGGGGGGEIETLRKSKLSNRYKWTYVFLFSIILRICDLNLWLCHFLYKQISPLFFVFFKCWCYALYLSHNHESSFNLLGLLNQQCITYMSCGRA